MKILIKNGRVVTPRGTCAADVLIEGSRIAQVGEGLSESGCNLYDAAGCLLFPGFIDAHTHLDMDNGVTVSSDDFETGTAAAVCGGTTTILDFATQDRGGTLAKALADWHTKSDGKASCDYGFHMAITDWNDEVSREIDGMAQAGVTSFKLYLAYDNLRLPDGQVYEVLKRVHQIGGIVGTHCENGDLINELAGELRRAGKLSPRYHPFARPDYVEAEAFARYCYIALAADAPVNIVHLSTRLGLEEARRARARGQQVYIETCPQYLMLDESLYEQPGFEAAKYVCSPPLRTAADREALWDAISNNEVDTISTDHCGYNFKGQKELGRDDFMKIPNGMPGVEHRPAVLYTYGVEAGRMTEGQMAAMLSENTARLFGMYPQKGVVAPGADADIVVWDPSYSGVISVRTQHQNCDYTPLEGMAVHGRAKAVFLRGEQVVSDGEVIRAHRGAFVARGRSDLQR